MALAGLKEKCTLLKNGNYALYISHRTAGSIATYHGAMPKQCYEAMEADSINLAQIWLEIHKPTPSRISLDGMCVDFKSSTQFANYAPNTQREWSRTIDRIRHDLGHLTRRDLEHARATSLIMDWRDKYLKTPRKADYGVQVLQAVLKHARRRGNLLSATDPCKDVDKVYYCDRSEVVWSKQEIEALCANTSKKAALAFLFLYLTGFRRGDAISVTWNNIDDGFIKRKTAKSRGKVFQSVPILPELQAVIDLCPKVATTILTNSKGRPWTGDGLRAAFDKARVKIGLTEKRLHDMRGTNATAIVNEILRSPEFRKRMGWSGNQIGAAKKYVAIENVLKTNFGE